MSARPAAQIYVGVALGGACGASLRVLLMSAVESGSWASLTLVNTLGCLLIGLIWRYSESARRRTMPPWLSIALMSGLCGALTTYSAAVLWLWEAMATVPLTALLKTMLAAVCWLLATGAGLMLGQRLNPIPSQPEV